MSPIIPSLECLLLAGSFFSKNLPDQELGSEIF